MNVIKSAFAVVGVLAVLLCVIYFSAGLDRGVKDFREADRGVKIEVEQPRESKGDFGDRSALPATLLALEPPAKVKIGETLSLSSGDVPPMPKAGFPVTRFAHGRSHLVKLLKANDFDGLMQDCDLVNSFFCRVGTKLLVLAEEVYEGEPWLEVRVKSGAYAGESGWLPAAMAKAWAKPKAFDESRWSPNTRHEIHKDYMKALEKSLAQAAKSVGGRSDPDGKYAPLRKRFEVETAAVELFSRSLSELREEYNVTHEESLAIVLFELASGETIPFTDR